MFLAQDIDRFYLDLQDEHFVSAVVIYHQRYSTNTFPRWELAQPFRMLAHNGEINTLRGNKNWMKSHEIRMVSEAFGDHVNDVKPVIPGDLGFRCARCRLRTALPFGAHGADGQIHAGAGAWSKRDSVMPPPTARFMITAIP